jgi:serine protease AprX
MARITINGISIDPIKQAPALAAANLISADASRSNFILVQVTAPLTAAQRQQLADLGVEIHEYVPEDTYVCRYLPEDLGPIRALPFVSWVNVYLQGFKVSPKLQPTAAANLLALTPAAPSQSKDRVTVEVVLHQNSMTDAVRDRIAAAAGVDPSQVTPGRSKIRLSVEERRLNAIAAIDEVHHIEKFFPPRLSNNIARGILKADEAQAAGAMRGEGQIVCVADTGFDRGVTSDVHAAFQGRVVRLYALGRSNAASDPDGHGTHVCGSVLGELTARDGTVIRGTAPAARLVMQSVLDSSGGLGGLPDDLHDLFLPPYRDDGARIHTNSWGGAAEGAYTANSGEVDDFVANHRDCVICFAAGNDGKDVAGTGIVAPGSVGSPATAKNCIAVGATESNRPTFAIPTPSGPITEYGEGWSSEFPVKPISPDPVANNPEGMAAFSSRGPAANHRVRPDVVAPGTAILSTRSRVATGEGWGPYTPDPRFFFDGGTSMATPLAAGCAAVVRQFLLSQNSKSPSAALVKAMLINGATPIHGQYVPPEVGAPPDNSQGFGRIDLAATVGPHPSGTTVVFKDEATTLDTGQSEETRQAVAAGQTLKVTLVWTDPAGAALQNDLDLVVTTSDGQEFHGNVAAGATGFDRSNNVEQVVVPNIAAGTATITVRAFRSVSPQSYALVVRVS